MTTLDHRSILGVLKIHSYKSITSIDVSYNPLHIPIWNVVQIESISLKTLAKYEHKIKRAFGCVDQ